MGYWSDRQAALLTKRTGFWRKLSTFWGFEEQFTGGKAAEVLTSVYPMIDVREIMRVESTPQATVSVTAASTYTIYTCPAGKRARLYGVHVTVSTGTWTMNRLQIKAQSGNDMTIFSQTTGTLLFYLLPHPIPMSADGINIVRIVVDAFTTTGNMWANVIIEEEDVYA